MAVGGFEGAHEYDQDLLAWQPARMSPDAAYIPEKQVALGRIEDSVRNDAYIQGGLNTRKDAIVGDKFQLRARPDSRILFGKYDETFETEAEEEIEAWWEISTDGETWMDAARKLDFTEQVRLSTGIKQGRGEVFGKFEYLTDGFRPFATAFNFISGDRISNNMLTGLKNNVRDGVTTDKFGAPISYSVASEDPFDFGFGFRAFGETVTWTEVPRYTEWGRVQMLHMYTQVGAAQTRGIPELLCALKEMRITKDFRDITLQKAVAESTYVGAITSDMPIEKILTNMGVEAAQGATIDPKYVQKMVETYGIGYYKALERAGSARINGVKLPYLYPGSKLEFFSPSGSTTLGSDFEKSLLRYLASSLGLSYEEFSHDFSNTNYSSARAALALTRKSVLAEKRQTADRFASTLYKAWLEEMLCKGAFTTIPKQYRDLKFLWSNPLRMQALARAKWIGATMTQIDELKETTAAVMRVNNGFSTWEAELAKNGLDYRQVFRQLGKEQTLAAELNLDLSVGGLNAVKPIVSKAPNDENDTSEDDAADGAGESLLGDGGDE